jgi:pimeloyl-ACP methyl ester carboxylesterase
VKRRLALVALLVLAVLGALWLRPVPAPRPPGSWMADVGVQPAFATVGGLRVRYVRRGAGPTLLLLHGLASSIYSWKDVIGPLSARHDVIALDLPGFGASDIPRDLDAALYPRVVLGLLDGLGVARASVAGNSLGGAVAIVLAARRPERVERLVLIDSAGFNFDAADRPWVLRLAGSAAVTGLLERLPVQRPLARLGLRQVFHDDRLVTPERVAEYEQGLARPGAVAFVRELLDERQDMGFPGIVSAVRAPTLILWGAEDAWIPVEHARRFAEAIPGSRTAVIPACGHVPQEERPDEVARLLLEFLDARPGGS